MRRMVAKPGRIIRAPQRLSRTNGQESLHSHLRLPDERVRLATRWPTCCARREGYEPTDDPEEADLILFNTCSVREKAQEKVLQRPRPGQAT
jgi:hypothetical protein